MEELIGLVAFFIMSVAAIKFGTGDPTDLSPMH